MTKPRAKKSTVYPEVLSVAQEIQEAAAAYGVRCDVINVRQARDQLSNLLERAARGEEIVITSDGRPKAMIVRYRPKIVGAKWISQKALRDTMPMGPDSAELLDEIRSDQV
jgi:prevent-host-death family protein